MSEPLSPRRVAALVLVRILTARRTLDKALEDVPEFGALDGPDRAFARLLASTVLRELGRIDKGLAPFLKSPIERFDPAVAALLRVGAAQCWCLGTPAHAAVSETVAAARQEGATRRAAGLINAVLRRAARDRKAFDAAPEPSVWPDWLVERLRGSLGDEGLVRLAAAQRRMPELHITARDPEAAARTLDARIMASGSLALPVGAVEGLAGYADGAWWVQDAAAALPARLLDVSEGEPVVDLCAAPGGKTMQLAMAGACVSAIDRSKPRLKRLAANLERTQLSGRVSTFTANAETWRPGTPVGKLLLDAPCSALGTLRRHPEGAWIKRPEDIARFPDIQSRMLAAAADMLIPGGRLIYCVCTPLRAEGEEVISAALDTGRWRRDPPGKSDLPGFEHALTAAGDLLTLPEAGEDHDAFFIARLTRL